MILQEFQILPHNQLLITLTIIIIKQFLTDFELKSSEGEEENPALIGHNHAQNVQALKVRMFEWLCTGHGTLKNISKWMNC